MLYTFDYFENKMKENPRIRVTRKKWNDSRHYIQWDSKEQVFREHLPDRKPHEWCWDNSDRARDDLLTKDWRQLPFMQLTI